MFHNCPESLTHSFWKFIIHAVFTWQPVRDGTVRPHSPGEDLCNASVETRETRDMERRTAGNPHAGGFNSEERQNSGPEFCGPEKDEVPKDIQYNNTKE